MLWAPCGMKVLLLVAAGVLSHTRAQLYVDYDRMRPLHIVDEQYINYNIDTGSLYNGMDFGDAKFRQLVRQLTAPFGPQVLCFAAREPTFLSFGCLCSTRRRRSGSEERPLTAASISPTRRIESVNRIRSPVVCASRESRRRVDVASLHAVRRELSKRLERHRYGDAGCRYTLCFVDRCGGDPAACVHVACCAQ